MNGKRVKEFFIRHRLALFLAVAASLLYGFHHAVLSHKLERQNLSYYPTLIGIDDKYHTIAKIKEVYLTGFVSGDVSLAEYPHAPAVMPPLPHLIMGYFAKIFNSITRAFIASSFLFPAASFFLFYLLGFEMTRARTFSAFFATFLAIMPRYLLYFPFITEYGRAWAFAQLIWPQNRLYLNRLEDPLITVPFLFLALYLVWRALARNERLTLYAAALSSGVLFYVYFYYAVYLWAGLLLISAIFLMQKNYVLAKRLALIIGLGLLTTAYYWIRFLALVRLPSYPDLILRIGPEHGYKPFLYPQILFAYAQHTALAIGVYLFFRKYRPAFAAYLTGMLLAVFAIYNFQVVTGFNPQPDHWIKPRQFILAISIFALGYGIFTRYRSWLTFRSIGIFAGLFVTGFIIRGVTTANQFVQTATLGIAGIITFGGIAYWISRKYIRISATQIMRIFVSCAILLLFIKGAAIQRRFIKESLPKATLPKTEESSYQWLLTNSPPGSVVGTPSFLTNTLIKHLTYNKIFVPDGFDTIASDKEVLNRMYLINRLFSVDPKTFGTYFATKDTYPPADEDHEGISYLFTDRYRAAEPGSIFTSAGYAYPVWPDGLHQKVVDKYAAIFAAKEMPFPYRIDYLYYGPRERAFADDPTKSIPSLKLVYHAGGIKIYAIKKD